VESAVTVHAIKLQYKARTTTRLEKIVYLEIPRN